MGSSIVESVAVIGGALNWLGLGKWEELGYILVGVGSKGGFEGIFFFLALWEASWSLAKHIICYTDLDENILTRSRSSSSNSSR